MDRSAFSDWVRRGRVYLDGATGTWLQSHGMPRGACPERWALDHGELVERMHREYYLAGSDIVISFTFGGTSAKMVHYGIGPDQVEAINRDLARITVRARDVVREEIRTRMPGRPEPVVSGDIGPTGRFLEPAGDLSIRALVSIYRSQVRGLLAGGVEMFSIETMMDLGQTLAALRAVREECDLPVVATLTFDASGRTLSGNSPLECAVALEAAGADAFGANCSTGPEAMGALLEGLAGRTRIPLAIKPNAGMPRLVDGNTVFDMGPDAFADAMLPFVRSGAGTLFGGCCGTTPEHIAALVRAAEGIAPAVPDRLMDPVSRMICSPRRSVPAPGIERISFIPAGDPDDLQDAVTDAMEEGPEVLGIDFTGIPDPDADAFSEALGWVQTVCSAPLVFRSDDAALLEALTAVYAGRAGIVTRTAGHFGGALRLD